MPATIQFTKTCPKKCDAYVVPVIDGKLSPKLKDHLPDGIYKAARAACNAGDDDARFTGKHGETYAFSSSDGGAAVWYVLLGLDKKATALRLERAGGKLYKQLQALKIREACLIGERTADEAAAVANGVYLRAYAFMKYKTAPKNGKGDKNTLSFSVMCEHKANADKNFATLKTISESVHKARDLVSEPPNVLYPESYVREIKAFLKGTPVKITVLDEKKLEKMGAGAIMAVGKASVNPPRIVIMEYDGRRTKTKKGDAGPLAMVGKGLTFDTGGYCLKPGKSMETMKMDMGGSAAVVGAMRALAVNGVETHVIGAVALAENMIAGNGYRVDDVLTTLSGQTVEVINTDAEGRLCLADAMTYVQNTYNPRAIVDIATLTGACMAALGLDLAGAFSNRDSMARFFVDSGAQTGDDIWHLPLNEAFDKQIDSPIADMRNLGTTLFAGASTAAAFLQRFITDGRPWTHLDIAGTAWRQTENDLCDKGASGFGVRALYHWASHYEGDKAG